MKRKRCSVPIQMSDDVITEILSYLPAKSIHRFRLVSKTWCSLFSSTNFIKLHFNHAIIKQDRFSLVLTDMIEEKPYLIPNCDSLASNNNKTLNLMDYPFISSGNKSNIITEAYCNGLFCCSYDRQFHIWNPSTNEYKAIPNTPFEESKLPVMTAGCGLGYDCKLDDYKFVIIYSLLDGANFFSGIEVYTLGSDSWNGIKYIPYKIYKSCRVNVFLNGAIHWLGTRAPSAAAAGGRCSSSSYDVVISFDMVHETVKDVPLPKELNVKSSSLGVLRDRLCIFDNNKSKAQTQVWVTKDDEHGGGVSWTKLFSIQTDKETPLSHYLRLVKCFNNGLMLLQKGNSDLVLYDPKHKTFTKLRYMPSKILTISYVENLVSLNSTTYFKQSKNLVM